MKPEHWKVLQNISQGVRQELYTAFIVDSPWIPGFLGISTIDYINIPEVWFEANMEIHRRFPKIIFIPGFWVEMGMAAEPSGYGCHVSFFHDQLPKVRNIINDVEEIDNLRRPNPREDGLMPLILSQYKHVLPWIRDAGMDIKLVAARGPLALASHLMGVTNFLITLKIYPQQTHVLLRKLTTLVKEWLEAQAEVLPGVDGLFILDDIMGFLSEEDYLQFAHPYFKEILSIPVTLRMLHNDTPNPVCFKYMEDLGINIFNFSHQIPISEMRRLAGESVALMGNISPLDVMVYGSAKENYEAAKQCIEQNQGDRSFLLSAGGGLSMGTPESTIKAIQKAVDDINKE